MKTYNDILKILKRYGTYIHLGDRLYDMELVAIELDRLHKAGLIENREYATAKIILRHEHENQLEHPLKLNNRRTDS